MNYIVLALVAVLYGFVEQWIFRHGYRNTGVHWFRISPHYHLPLLAIWFATCFLAGAWWAIGAFCVLEDWSYFRFHPDDTLDKSDWVNFGLGGFRLFGTWIPTSYIGGLGLSCGLYYFLA